LKREFTIFLICLALFAADALLFAEPPDDAPPAPPSPAEEAQRLETLKGAAFQKLKTVIFGESSYEEKLKALRGIAGLAMPESIELLSTLYDSPLDESNQQEKLLIVELLEKIGSPACAPALLKACSHPGKDGNVRRAAATALRKVTGKQATLYLDKLTKDRVEEVRNQAWLELLVLRDSKAVHRAFKMLEGKDKPGALRMIASAHLRGAAQDVAKLAADTDPEKGRDAKVLKLTALEVALGLGHSSSVEHVIEMVGTISKEQAEVLDVKSPVALLEEYTREDFGSDKKKWQQWWDGKGKDTPLFSSYLNTTALREIGTAVLEYGKSSKSEPFAKGEVVYLENSPIALAVAKPDGSIRVYTGAELEILKVRYLRITGVVGNGDRAFVDLHDVGGATLYQIELQKKEKVWRFKEIMVLKY